jgi:hypothetical protein
MSKRVELGKKSVWGMRQRVRDGKNKVSWYIAQTCEKRYTYF